MKEEIKTVAGSEDKKSAAADAVKDTSGFGNKRKTPIPTVRETRGGKPA